MTSISSGIAWPIDGLAKRATSRRACALGRDDERDDEPASSQERLNFTHGVYVIIIIPRYNCAR